MDKEQYKNAAEREADEALEAILNEIDAAPKKSAANEIDEALTERRPVRRPAADDEAPRRRRPVEEGEAPRRRRPVEEGEAPRRRRPVEEGEAPRRRPRPVEEGEAPRRRPRPTEENAAPRRRPRPVEENAALQRRPRPTEENAAPRRTRPAAEQTRQQNAQTPVKRRSSGSGKAHASAKNKPSYFGFGLLIYVIIFMLVTMFIMHRLYVYLGEYEQSRPQYTIDGYVSSLNNGFKSDMIRQKIGEMQVSEYETAETISETLNIEEIANDGYTWAKKVADFTDETPVYYIRSGDAAIAEVKLERAGGTDEYDFPKWKVCEPVSLIEIASEPEYSVDVTIPKGGSLLINGIAYPSDLLTEGESSVQLDNAALNYAQQPAAQHAVVDGLFVAPKIQAFDEHGSALEASVEPEEHDKAQVYVFEPKSEAVPDPQIITRVEEMMRAYINYMVNKDDQVWTNLGYLDNYLVNGSAAHQKLHGIVQDVNWNNPYDARVDRALDVKEIKMYSDSVFTCEVYYDYQLTKKVVNDYSGTIKWTFVKTGNVWSATDFAILSSNDNNFAETGDGTGEAAVVDKSDT